MFRKIYLLLIFALSSTIFINAQVTTSAASGTVKGQNNEALVGATVVLTHTPTGTVYKTTTKTGGVFNIQNINPGGPYSLEVSNVGYETYQLSDITVPLGEVYQATVDLTASSQQLKEVIVTGTARNQRIGTATNISRAQITNLPNISRSLMDVTKLTPQGNNGGSFMGMSNRYNNITIDGSIFNNNFGLGGNALPGGSSQPISIDAIDQMQVNLAPYDVRQAGFTGAGINAVTRRGTNNWYGTVYDYYKNQNFNGTKVDGQDLPPQLKSSSNIVGASVGGPIIKNKLFFFVNGEYEKRTGPGQVGMAQSADHKKGDPNVLDNVTEADMNRVSDFLKSKYNYDPGEYQAYDFGTTNKKFLARVDWNINERNRLTFRYNQSETSADNLTNTNSGPNPRISNGRNGGSTASNGLNFSNANYKQNNNVYSGVLELNSKFSGSTSNQLLASYTKIKDFRATPGSPFPFVDIMRDPSNVLMSFGSEIYSYKNSLANATWNLSDNFSWNVGRHNLLGGLSFDYLTFANSFANYGGQSYYRFASIDDFINGAPPTVYAVTYSNTDRAGITPGEAKFAQFGFYLQDNFTVSSRFKLTYGARFDVPSYPGSTFKNDALAAVALKDKDGNPFRADVGVWPRARLLVSPRVGFNYDITEDKEWVVRGGTGIFTGRIPFVWLVNQSGDNGVLNTLFSANSTDKVNGLPKYDMTQYLFNPDRTAHIPNPLPDNSGGNANGSYYSVTAPKFKMPQVWRSNLAIDKRFGNGYTATIEGIYSKTLNSVYHYNANLGAQTGTLNLGGDNRPVYSKSLVSSAGQVFVMDNNSKGYSFSLTGQLQKTFSKNWQASVAYTYNIAKDVSPNNGDRSQSSWTQNTIVNDPNHPELGYSMYSIPHRVTAFVSYKFEYANKNLASTVSLVYSGSSQERYLYRYSADLNGDGATNDLLYVPASRTGLDQSFANLTVNGTTYTPQQQADAFWTFVESDKYLREHKGQYIDRYGALLPWVNHLDFRFLQDISPTIGNKRHTLQVSLDVQNFLALLNNSWGNQYTYNYGGFSDQGILGVSGGKYTFLPSNATKPVYQKYYGLGSTWGMQLGLRYIF